MKSHETHLPTQQTPPQENTRFPRPYENGKRPKDHQSPQTSRPQKTGCMKFPQSARLKTRREFQRVAREGKRQVGKFLCIDCRPAAEPKLGISASNRYGSAPERNRFKRLVRESFRRHYPTLPPYHLNIIPRHPSKHAKYEDIEREMIGLLGKI
jgi:ribonuclease P protein component